MIAVATFKVEAEAEVAEEALTAVGIPVEIRRMGGNPYFGSATREEWELRVPEEEEQAALTELARVSEDAAQAAIDAAGVPRGDESDEPDREPRRKISWAIAFGIWPLPGVACMYARSFGIGLTLFAASVVFGLAAVLGINDRGIELYFGAKLVDLILAPFLVARYNRRLEEQHAARS